MNPRQIAEALFIHINPLAPRMERVGNASQRGKVLIADIKTMCLDKIRFYFWYSDANQCECTLRKCSFAKGKIHTAFICPCPHPH